MIKLTTKRKARLLGSLFHDIGKFQYRSEKTTDRHEQYSAQFVRKHFARIECVFPFIDDVERIARDHHNKYSDTFVKLADHLNASDRIRDDKAASHRPLLSIFTNIDIKKGNPPQNAFYHQPVAISIDEKAVFPTEHPEIPKKWKPDTVEMRTNHLPSWKSFNEELQKIPTNITFEALYDTVYALLEKWTSRVSSASYYYHPDISLFDHSRVVANYTDCLSETDDINKPFLVVEGDVSGIQNFIYRLARPSEGNQKKSAKTLRGRSLFVVLLTDSIADFILKELGLFKIHLLMNGGGHFHILMPNTKACNKKLDSIEKKINQWLLKEYNADLGLILTYKAFSKDEITDYSSVKLSINQQLNRKKHQKYITLFDNEFNVVTGPFEPPVDNVKWDVCSVCEADCQKSDEKICPNCKLHQQVGENLPKTKYLLKVNTKELDYSVYNSKKYKTFISMKPIGVHWFFLNDDAVSSIEKDVGFFSSANHLELSVINSSDILSKSSSSAFKHFSKQNLSLSFKFIGNYTPIDHDGSVKEFEDLANEKNGYPMLQILRMDVDSLGKIFAYGIKDREKERDVNKGPRSISRVANLSREMNLFFCGYLNKVAKNSDIYITYSGGDDLFVVGKWTNIIKFAQNVREDFRRFTCGNPNLSISGGAVLVHPSFPIRRSAILAGEAEKRAKSFSTNKNAFCLFDEVYDWSRISELISWGKKFVCLINVDKKYRNMARFLKQLKDSHLDRNNLQNIEWIYKVKHKVAYMLSRNAELNHVKVKELKEKFEKQHPENSDLLKYEVLGQLMSDAKLLNDITIPAYYSLLYTRKEKNQKLEGA